ncbi:MAG: aspartyl protease family protein, partial [Candidatus Bathyarchaeia archaeon]
MFRVQAMIWNPQDISKNARVEVSVDTGSTYTVLPSSILYSLGIKSVRTVNLRLADGRVLEK